MGEYTGKGWTCPHCFGHIEWEQTPYGRYEQERDTLAAENRWLREKVAATAGWLASYADSARV